MIDESVGVYGWAFGVRADEARPGVEVVGHPAGPAGVASVQFGDGTEWEVDGADPARLVRLWLPDGLDGPTAALAVGAEGVLVLADRLAGDDDAVSPPGADPFGRRRPRQGTWPGEFGPAADVGAAIRLHAVVDDADAPAVVRIAAAIEAAAAPLDAPLDELFEPVAAASLRRAGGLAGSLRDDEFDGIDPWAADELLRRARELPPMLQKQAGRWLRPFLDRLGRSTSREVRRVAAAPALGRLADLHAVDLGPADHGPDLRLESAWSAEPAGPQLRRIGAALVRVEVVRSDDERWVRVLHADGLLTLGMAPLRRSGLLDAAEVVVPPDVPDADLVVDVIDAGRLGGPSGLERIRRAVRAGRRAVRLSRVQAAVAPQAWDDCARAWAAAGDDRRARLAEQLRSPSAWPRVGPSAADGLVADEAW